MGIKVGLLSNNTADAGRKMRENAVDSHFDVFHVSGETGLMKPSPEAFEFFARELGVKAIELAFIDDSESSLNSAEICGFTPILFKSYEDLHKELVALRILDQ